MGPFELLQRIVEVLERLPGSLKSAGTSWITVILLSGQDALISRKSGRLFRGDSKKRAEVLVCRKRVIITPGSDLRKKEGNFLVRRGVEMTPGVSLIGG